MLKAEAINQAYGMIRISGLTTTAIPEEVTVALAELDQLMYQWRSIGRDVHYNFPIRTTDNALVLSDPSDLLGVYDWALAGVIAALAGNLVEYFGKEVPANITKKIRFGVNTIKQRTVDIPAQQYPRNMPIGSGNRFGNASGYLARFYYPVYPGRGGQNDTEIIVTQNMDLTSDFSSDMVPGDSLLRYTIEADERGGVELVSDTQVGNVVYFRVLATKASDGKVTITGTTNNGLILPRAYCFNTVENACVVTLDA